MAEKKVIDVWALLNKKFPASEYALMQEVSDASGHYRSNSADYIAVNLWPSRGHTVTGIELKRSRNDWQRELKRPDKAENIMQYCDYFWLLTTDETIAKIEEIPDTWGWMNIKGATIKIMKQAPKLEPKIIGRSFMCAMLKRACDKSNFVHKDSIADRIEAASQIKYDNALRDNKHRAEQHIELTAKVREFEQYTGLNISKSSWRGNEYLKGIGEAVNVITSGGVENVIKRLTELHSTAERIYKSIGDNIEKLQINSEKETEQP